MTDRNVFLALLGAGGIALLFAAVSVLSGDATCGSLARCSSQVPVAWAMTGAGFMLGAIAMAIFMHQRKD